MCCWVKPEVNSMSVLGQSLGQRHYLPLLIKEGTKLM